MDDVVELEDVENVCRLCLSAEEPKSSIFDAQESTTSLAAKIQACLSIEVSSNDRLSTLICEKCIKNVNDWHEYRESCLRSQDRLHRWLANQLQPVPMVVTIKDEPVDLDFYEDNVEVLSETTNLEQNMTDLNRSSDAPLLLEDHVEELSDDHPEVSSREKDLEIFPLSVTIDSRKDISHIDKQPNTVQIKTEPDDYDTDCTIEIESITGSELLLSPTSKEDTIMEADSTQKSNATASHGKKKTRRGPHTHFRGTRVFKQKCKHCQYNLHSKYSYMKHMERFHSPGTQNNFDSKQPQEDEEIEDLEDELISMEKDSPLTQVQQNIISQLKTFSCYSCQQTFSDRRSTLSHIRQHMPDLRPYTCIACLTEFPDRSMYKLHCADSFECAMKIALVIPKHGSERYFTCNMCLRPLSNRKELLSHLSKHSDKQYEELMSPAKPPPKLKPMAPLPSPKKSESLWKIPAKTLSIPSPYKNGDPAHNHVCDLCGMIYRYKPNMLKHRELCLRLSPDLRTCYRCIHCGMTFLIFKKYHTHITIDHKKKEFACSQCTSKFRSPSDYLSHHETHRNTRLNRQTLDENTKPSRGSKSPLKQWQNYDEMSPSKSRVSGQKYGCALCCQEFVTRAELAEHKNLHLKVKIYSCVICRSMFSSPGALEIHMKDHGIEDPSERNANISCIEYGQMNDDSQESSLNVSAISEGGIQNECNICNKVFSNNANLCRHMRNVHKNGKGQYTCHVCARVFKSKDVYDRHLQLEHKSTKTMLKCPQCPKTFVFPANLKLHCESAHGNQPRRNQACDICGKEFAEEASLKIHKGWHNRANSRFNTRFINSNDPVDTKPVLAQNIQSESSSSGTERPARARKSFPNPPPTKPQGNFQCQVCDDHFSDVTELRKHLWDVHCAWNKPEKSFSGDELQCELCTNVFPDPETLKMHMQWHKAHPILSDIRKKSYPCEICGKHYSSIKILYRHKKLHKATTVASMKLQSLSKKSPSQAVCTVCRKAFSSNQSLQRHKLNFHNDLVPHRPYSTYNSSRRTSIEEPRSKKIKIEAEDNPISKMPFSVNTTARKKPVMCHLCKKFFPDMSVLYRHKQVAHKPRATKALPKIPMNECVPLIGNDGKVSCNICHKQFPGISNLRQHFTLKHKNIPKFICQVDGCKMAFPTALTLKNHEVSHTSMIFCCNLCDRHVFNRAAMTNHMSTIHNTVYDAETNRSFHRETDLRIYEVQGAVNATCPHCKIKYPNNKAMKIHYFKFHETVD